MQGDASGWVEAIWQSVTVGEWSDAVSEHPGFVYSEDLGRLIRRDEDGDRATSTYAKVTSALAASEFSTAAEYIGHFVREVEAPCGFYLRRIPKVHEFLRERGVTTPELTDFNRDLLDKLQMPDGRPFRPRRLWSEIETLERAAVLACGASDRDTAECGFITLKEACRRLHDRLAIYCYGLFNFVVERFGEEALGDIADSTLFWERYGRFDVTRTPWEQSLDLNVYLALEAMRGHLSGPGREGGIEFTEDDERFTLRFDPCGTGGTFLRGNDIEGTPPLMEPPFEFGVTKDLHDYTWNKRGVCYYCTNCCVMFQMKAIDEFGYPVRVVEPPTYPQEANTKCTWHIYKDPSLVPERYFTEVGREKPLQPQPSATDVRSH